MDAPELGGHIIFSVPPNATGEYKCSECFRDNCDGVIQSNNGIYMCNKCKRSIKPDKDGFYFIEKKLRKVHPDGKGFCNCDKCGRPTSTKVCPTCKSVLPYSITESPTRVISIVGAASSGKSYYVGAVLRKIMDEGLFSQLKFNGISSISTVWADKEKSRNEYIKRFRNRMDTFKILPPTDKFTDLVKDNPPLLVEMTLERRRLEHCTFSFFDAAGESFQDAGDLAAITPYIAHSEAVILILDPRQIPKLDSDITNAIPGLPAVATMTYSEILDNAIRIIRNDSRLGRGQKIRIPLCVAFSKWDLVMETPSLIPEGLVCGQGSQQMVDGYNEQRIDTISNEIRSLLMQQWNEAGLVSLAEQNFETVKYFSFSAWGSSNSGKTGAPAIASFRVEDPILWILHRNRII